MHCCPFPLQQDTYSAKEVKKQDGHPPIEFESKMKDHHHKSDKCKHEFLKESIKDPIV